MYPSPKCADGTAWLFRCSMVGGLWLSMVHASALKQDAKRQHGKNDQDAHRDAVLARLRAVIAEITAENLELKKEI